MKSGSQVRKSLGKKPGLFNGEILKISETNHNTTLDKVIVFLIIVLCLGRWERFTGNYLWRRQPLQNPTYQTCCLILPPSQGKSFWWVVLWKLREDKICTPGEPVLILAREISKRVNIVGYLCCNAIHSEIQRRDDVAFPTCKDSKNTSKVVTVVSKFPEISMA